MKKFFSFITIFLVILQSFSIASIFAVAEVPSELPHFGQDAARDFAFTSNGDYYILDGYGAVHGNGVIYPGNSYWDPSASFEGESTNRTEPGFYIWAEPGNKKWHVIMRGPSIFWGRISSDSGILIEGLSTNMFTIQNPDLFEAKNIEIYNAVTNEYSFVLEDGQELEGTFEVQADQAILFDLSWNGGRTKDHIFAGSNKTTPILTPFGDMARDIEIVTDEAENVLGYYILDAFGDVQAIGNVPDNLSGGPYFGWDITRDLEVVQTANGTVQGYYILDGFGGVHTAGNVPIQDSLIRPGQQHPYVLNDIARDIEVIQNAEGNVIGYYVLDGYGNVTEIGDVPSVAQMKLPDEIVAHWDWDIARDIEMNKDSNGNVNGYYLLDGIGAVHTVGPMKIFRPLAYWPNEWDIAKDLELEYHNNEVACVQIMDGYAGIHRTCNTNPEIQINMPAEGEAISGIYNIVWNASDFDNDTLTIKLEYRLAGEDFFTISNNKPNDGSYLWDSSHVNDGEFTLRLIATDDDNNSGSDNVNFRINNIPACRDTIDNDADNAIDYPADFGCENTEDDNELNNGSTQCSDGLDNDGDSLIDQNDPGCSNREDNDENQAPILNPVGNREVMEGAELRFFVSGSDPENDDIEFSAINLPFRAVFNTETKIFGWDPTYTQAGIYNNVTFIVTDGKLSTQETITITVLESGNHAPQIVSLPVESATEGALYQYDVEAIDLDSDDLTYSLMENPTGMEINDATGLISWTPSFDDAGIHNITVQVTDGSLTDAQTYFINVENSFQQCEDGIDNDADNAIDYPGDFSCSSLNDNDEENPKSQCQDGIDNDADGLVDFGEDSGCESLQDNDEANLLSFAAHITVNPSSGIEPLNTNIICGSTGGIAPYFYRINFGDGQSTEVETSQINVQHTYSAGTYEIVCFASDAQNDDADRFTLVVVQSSASQCSDRIDNDADGAIDYPADFSCSNADDNDEENPKAQCQDGIDNDADGLTDFGEDPGCLTLQDNDEFNQFPIVITTLECIPKVMIGDIQSCSVFTEANNQELGGANINIYYKGTNQLFGSCTSDLISGGCVVNDVQEEIGGHVLYATAEKQGFISDIDRLPEYAYEVWPHQYDIANLKVYNDPNFLNEDYEFLRNQDLYVKFQVLDTNNDDQIVQNIVTRAELISTPGGRAELTQTSGNDDSYHYYKLTPIPPTHEFKGFSQVFTFAFNFEDQTIGQEEVALTILNNPPVITQNLDDLSADRNSPLQIDLTGFESDIEDGPAGNNNNLDWTVSGADSTLMDSSIDQNDVLTINPRSTGSDNILITLTDLDGSVLNDPSGRVSQEIIVTITEELAACSDGIDNDADGAIDYPADFSCSNADDNDEENPKSQCQDGIDNDADGLTDFGEDPGCESLQDNDEFNNLVPAAILTVEPTSGVEPLTSNIQCSGTGGNEPLNYRVDFGDGQLTGISSTPIGVDHVYNVGSYDIACIVNDNEDTAMDTFTLEVEERLLQCSDNTDNDADGSIDWPNDFGCEDGADDDELNNGNTQCSDGLDNDGDSLIDQNDPGCTNREDNDENEAPVVQNMPGVTIIEDSGLNNNLILLEPYASDRETSSNNLIYTIQSQSRIDIVECAIDQQNYVDCTTQQDMNGLSLLTIRVADTQGRFSEGTLSVTVTPQNDEPFLVENIPDQTWNEDTANLNAFDLDDYFNDADTSVLTFIASTADNPNIVVAISSDGLVSFTQPADFNGQESVVFTASDGTSAVHSNSVRLTVLAAGDAPVLNPIGSKQVYEESLLRFTISATDSDNDQLTFQAFNLPRGAAFDSATRTFSWTPDITQSGIYTNVIFRVTDGTSSDEESITITVLELSNHAPRIISTPITTANQGELYIYDVDAVDADNDRLTYSLLKGPSGMTIDSVSGFIKWVPKISQKGRNLVSVHVSDGNLTDTQEFQISVSLKERIQNSKRALVLQSIDFLDKDPLDLSAGDTLHVAVTLKNNDVNELNRVQMSAALYEFGEVRGTAPFDIPGRQTTTKLLTLQIPDDAQEGTYDLNIYVSDDKIKRNIFREIKIS